MNLPSRLHAKLAVSQDFRSAVDRTLLQFQPWLRASRVPFFPEYTDHGPEHVESVLLSASSLIRDPAWDILTPADAAVLTLGVLLHDIGMHLTEDVFTALVLRSGTPLVPEFDAKAWATLWEEYRAETRRFDARTLLNVTGQVAPVEPPDLTEGIKNDLQRRLVGEFIRRHHPRMAHEFALAGVPGVGGEPLELRDVSDDVRDIAGLVARSHGMELRHCIDYLRRYQAIREHKGIHAVFLMSLIRVADYLQLQSERAPQGYLQVQRLRSPLSQREWAVHAAVDDIRPDDDDPEALFVRAIPNDLETYLRLEQWLAGIQAELDASWAVLGETYGYRPVLAELGLVLRRVKSNLRDREFIRSRTFFPIDVSFTTAHTDLTKLLVFPLYGRRPEIGVRELLQNAVDAVREMEDYLQQCPELHGAARIDQPADVFISVEEHEGGATLTVSDRGVGMTAETVQNYFLRAGATYRKSEAWLRRHADEHGRPRILRSGRFGIGALAAFLLGDDMEVTTRHVAAGSGEGVSFRARLDSERIELRRADCPVGTRISIRISEEVRELLRGNPSHGPFSQGTESKWDWYCLSRPSVQRQVLPSGVVLPQGFVVPSPSADERTARWRAVPHPDYDGIFWTYAAAPRLVHNGIRIDAARGVLPDFFASAGFFRLAVPKLAVFDRLGSLPLTLQRDGLISEDYPFSEQLAEDVHADFLAFAQAAAPARKPDERDAEPFGSPYDGLSGNRFWPSDWSMSPWFFTDAGVGFADPGLIAATTLSRLVLIGCVGGVPSMRLAFPDAAILLVAPSREAGGDRPPDLLSGLVALQDPIRSQFVYGAISGMRVVYIGPEDTSIRQVRERADRATTIDIRLVEQ